MIILWLAIGLVYAAGAMLSAFLLGRVHESEPARNRPGRWQIFGMLTAAFFLWWVFMAVLTVAGFVDLINDLRKKRA